MYKNKDVSIKPYFFSIVGWVEIRESFVGFRSSTQPTKKCPLSQIRYYDRNPTDDKASSDKKERAAFMAAPFWKEVNIGFILSPAGVLRWSVTITHVALSHHLPPAVVGAKFSQSLIFVAC